MFETHFNGPDVPIQERDDSIKSAHWVRIITTYSAEKTNCQENMESYTANLAAKFPGCTSALKQRQGAGVTRAAWHNLHLTTEEPMSMLLGTHCGKNGCA